MYRSLKVLHLLALTLFLGSILSHVITAIVGGEIGGSGFLAGRLQIDAATRFLTLPGLGLAILSGVGLTWLSPTKRNWIAAHATLATVIVILAFFVIVPAGRTALDGAKALPQGLGNIEGIHTALKTEHVAGVVNILLTLTVIVLGVYKPTIRMFTRRQPETRRDSSEARGE